MPHVPAQIRYVGSGTIVALALVTTGIALVALNYFVGWNATWRSFGVFPLEPHFFDMRAVTDNAACAAKGFDAYRITTCTSILPFNYPPIWLWLGKVGVDETDAPWLSIVMAAFAFVVLGLLLKGRSATAGIISSLALLSPPALMAVERGNIDLCIVAIVGAAAFAFSERQLLRYTVSGILISIAVLLKIYPVFCIAIAARMNRRTLIFSAIVAVISAPYFWAISGYLPLIRQNTPTTYVASYGYKVLFIGLEHLRAESGGNPLRLADTWMPLVSLLVGLGTAAAVAAKRTLRPAQQLLQIPSSAAGNAFLFGSGIYAGTFMLGSNFMYRLVFLILCLPQLQDWASNSREAPIANAFIAGILCALWSAGSNGVVSFMLISQIIDWSLFFGFSLVLLLSLNSNIAGMKRALVTPTPSNAREPSGE